MPIVTRGPDGKIVAIHEERRRGSLEEVPADHPEVLEFLETSGQAQQFLERLLASDVEMARVTEDLVETLIEKNLLMLTDLPEAARNKLMERRSLRDRMGSLVGLVEEDDIL
jgi:hypothetical protein